MMHKVYHGSTHIIEHPLCHIGRDNLDFGKGFYVTNIRKQAISWATRVVNLGLPLWLNIYEIDEEYIKLHAKCKTLIADDRVITTIEDYINGDISMDYALKRLSEHQPNNQICFISQKLLDASLHFIKAEPLNDLARKEK